MTQSQSDTPIPVIRATTGPTAATLDDVVDGLVLQVDRLRQTSKLLKWAAGTAIVFALGAAGAVGKVLYGMGFDAAAAQAAIERAQHQADANSSDIRELQRLVYSRHLGGGYLNPPSIDGAGKVDP